MFIHAWISVWFVRGRLETIVRERFYINFNSTANNNNISIWIVVYETERNIFSFPENSSQFA